jgi:3-polyprenyl-4-hydroxybenzoate decarboxylase
MGIDATNKIHGETTREWGEIILPDLQVNAKMEELYNQIFSR